VLRLILIKPRRGTPRRQQDDEYGQLFPQAGYFVIDNLAVGAGIIEFQHHEIQWYQ